MKKYRIPYKKIVTGYWEVEADNPEEALENYMDGDEFDYNSDYKLGEPEEMRNEDL